MEGEDEGDVIFVRWFRHHKTGKIVRPKHGNVIAIHIKKPRS